MKLLFRIEGLKPDRIPGAELASYMTELAKLLGERESVHFTAIRSESIGIETRVGVRARHKVRARMKDITLGGAADAEPSYDRINELLARRKTSAKLQELRQDGRRVDRLTFPGAAGQMPEVPALREWVQVQGILYRIEGRDPSVHAGLEDGEARYSIVLGRDQALAIAPHLFRLVRVEGEARLQRQPEGTWEIGEIRAATIAPLDDQSLTETVGALRAGGGFGWAGDGGGLDALEEVRASE